VSTKVLAATTSVAALLAIGWLVWPLRSPSNDRSEARAPESTGVVEPTIDTSVPSLAEEPQRSDRQAVVSPEVPASAVATQEGETVRGRVVDSNGSPVGDAEVWTSEWDLGLEPAARTDSNGGFELLRPERGFVLGARHPDFAPSTQLRVAKGEELGDGDIVLTLPGPAGRLSLQVLDRSSHPVAGARAKLGSSSKTALLPSGQEGRTPPPWVCQTNENGCLSTGGLAPGNVEVTVRAKGFKLWTGSCAVIASQEAHLKVALALGATIEGRISDQAGQPLSGVRVSAGPRQDYHPATVSTETDRNGQYLLEGVWEGEIRVSASSSSYGHTVEELEVSQGERLVWNAVLQPQLPISGRVVDEDDRPLENWVAALIKPGDSGHWLRNSRTDSDGRFELADPPKEQIDLEVRSRLQDTGPVVLVENVHAGDKELLVRVPRDRMPTAGIAGRIIYSDGSPCDAGRIRYSPVDDPRGMTWTERADSDGAFRIGPIRPIRYRLAVSDNDLSCDDLGEVQTAADEVKDLGDIVLQRSGSLIVLPTPTTPEGIEYFLGQPRPGERTVYRSWKSLPDRIPLRPGEYLLHARGSEYESEEISFRITPGATTTVSLPMVSRMAYALEFVCPDGAKVSQVEVEIRGFDDGALKRAITVSSDEQGRLISRFELSPGIYTLSAVADNGYKGTLNALSWGGGTLSSIPVVHLKQD
jgi:hypothetical protein